MQRLTHHAGDRSAMDEKTIEPPEKWSLSQREMDQFLGLLDADPDEAARKYLFHRRRLEVYFRCRGHWAVEELTDRTLDTAARKSSKVPITNMGGFIYGIARNISRESRGDAGRAVPLENVLPTLPDRHADDDPNREMRLACLEECLKQMPPARSAILRDYYTHRGREKVADKKRLAKLHGVTVMNLAVVAFRARRELRDLVEDCTRRRTR
jgi:DNA-directed RNA polymerase specialized sigma24 family protein